MRFTLPNDRSEIEKAQEILLGEIDRHNYPEASRFAIRLAFEEALANAFTHGSPQGQPVEVEINVVPNRLEISVEDHGPGFKPGDVPDPTATENISKPTGRGLLLIKAYMSEVRFNESGNRITMIYTPKA